MGDIPFMIELHEGSYAVHPLRFENSKIVHLKYFFACMTPKRKIMCFRSAYDARLTAKNNGWIYKGRTNQF